MDPKDKIDLTSVNKTKKQFKLPKLSNPLAKKSASPGRDQFGQFASGSGGIKGKSKWMNWKVMTVLVLLVAAVGGFYVFKSNAATGNYTFVHNTSQMSGGKLVTKSNGTSYRALDCSGSGRSCSPGATNQLYTLVSRSEMVNTGRICTHYIGATGFINIRHSSGKQVTAVANGSSGNLCMSVSSSMRSEGAIYVSVLSDGNPSSAPSNAQIDTIYGKPKARSADASCNISVAQATNGYTATWSSKGIDTSEAEGPVTMRLKNSATGTETPDLPLAGSRALSPKAGVNNVYTMTLYEGTTPTDLTCSDSVNLAPTTPPPATQVSCSLNITKSGTSYTASWETQNIPSGANWGATLSRPGGNVSFQPTTGSAGIVPPAGTTTYTVIIYDKAVSSTAAQNSWKTSCARAVPK